MERDRNKNKQDKNKVTRTHCGNWSLGGIMCRCPSGGVRVAPWVLVSWVASEIGCNSEMCSILISIFISGQVHFFCVVVIRSLNKC